MVAQGVALRGIASSEEFFQGFAMACPNFHANTLLPNKNIEIICSWSSKG